MHVAPFLLFGLEPDHFGHLRKGLDLGAYNPVLFLRRGGLEMKSHRLQPFLDVGQLKNAPDVVTDLNEDWWRCSGGREPRVRSISAETGKYFRHRRYVGQ